MMITEPIVSKKFEFPDIEKIINAGELVYLTKNGYGAMVVLSLEEYSKLTDGIETRRFLYNGQNRGNMV